MKIDIAKDESKGIFGGTKYKLRVTIRLEAWEEEVVKKHKMKDTIMISDEAWKALSLDTQKKLMPVQIFLPLKRFFGGWEHTFPSIQDMGNFEAGFVQSCKGLKEQLEGISQYRDQVGTSGTIEL